MKDSLFANREFSYNDIKNVKQQLAIHGLHVGRAMNFTLHDAENVMRLTMRQFLGDSFAWLPEYSQIAEWLTNTNGKGLLLYGNNGVGKTVMCRSVIPGIFLVCFGRAFSYYDYYDINKKADEIMARKFAAIDDIGNEDIASSYGSKYWALPQIIDRAEKNNNLLVLTTNLNGDDLLKKYGIRTYDRIKAITRRIKIEHPSFRQ